MMSSLDRLEEYGCDECEEEIEDSERIYYCQYMDTPHVTFCEKCFLERHINECFICGQHKHDGWNYHLFQFPAKK